MVCSNLPYLSLSDPSAEPTPLQKTALEVLTYTYPLLPVLPNLPAGMPTVPTTARRLAFDGLNVRDAHRHNNAVRPPRRRWYDSPLFLRSAILALTVITNPARLLLPISFIILRGVFIMYIFGFTPMQAPTWFGIILAYIGWEVWAILKVEAARLDAARAAARLQQIAAGLPQNGNAGADANGDANPLPPLADDHGVGGQVHNRQPNGHAAPAAQDRPAPVANGVPILPALLPANARLDHTPINRIAHVHLRWEREQLGIEPLPPQPRIVQDGQVMPQPNQDHLQGPASVPPHLLQEPTRWERLHTLVYVFVASIFPELWARRVEALRWREGQVREVYGRVWEAAEDDDDERRRVQAERRRALTGWRRDYVQRVIAGVGQDADL